MLLSYQRRPDILEALFDILQIIYSYSIAVVCTNYSVFYEAARVGSR